MRRFLIIASVLVTATLPAVADEIKIGEKVRTYDMHVPAGGVVGQARPLLIMLHGGGGSGQRVRAATNLDALATRGGFAVAYPDALGGQWNDGRHGTTAGRGSDTDDVRFIKALVEDLVRRGRTTPGQIAVAGVSNGGMMAFRLACETSGVFSAYAALIANMPAELAKDCKPAGGAAMMILAGTEDPLVPFKGGIIAVGVKGIVQSANDTYVFWGRANGCGSPGLVEELPDLNTEDKSTIVRQRATNCPAGAETVFYRVNGGGHTLPSRAFLPRPMLDRITGPTNRDFDAIPAMVDFVTGKTR